MLSSLYKFKGLARLGTSVFGLSTTLNLPSLFVFNSTLTLVALERFDSLVLQE